MRIRNTPATDGSRHGLTLFEIVLSIAIFTMAMAALSELVSVGTRAKNTAQFQTEAAIRAENKIAEVVAGHLPLSAVAGEPDPENDRWVWSLEVADAENTTGLKELAVTVTHLSQTGEADAAYTIKRFKRDPQLYIDAALAEEEAASAATAKANSANSSSSGASSGTGTSKTSGGTSSTPSTGTSASKASPSSGSSKAPSSGGGMSSSKAKSR